MTGRRSELSEDRRETLRTKRVEGITGKPKETFGGQDMFYFDCVDGLMGVV